MQNRENLLFCFSFAGGTADFYNGLEEAVDGEVKLVKLEYPGHGKRMKESLCHSFDNLTEDLYPQIIKELRNKPNAQYAFMGYSMGSIAAFDMMKKFVLKGFEQLPKHIFLAAHQPRTIVELKSISEDKINEWVKNRTIEFGGIDEKLLNNKSFWRIYLPIYTADYQMIATYNFQSVQFQTVIPATVFYSEKDTPYNEMSKWEQYFVGDCEYIKYEGSHFFIHQYYKDMAEVICRKMRSIQ